MSENSLVNRLEKDGSPLSLDNGTTPSIPDLATSTLHKEYSLDSDPDKLSVRPRNGNLPEATELAKGDGLTKYKDNLPAGGSI
tara:strand:- start:6259 stop:6507 length:249 start_codon:yes stop_codon:yes gene_type:complete